MNFSNAKECKIILNKKRAKVSARWRWREIEGNLYRLGRYWVGKSDVNVEFLSGFFSILFYLGNEKELNGNQI